MKLQNAIIAGLFATALAGCSTNATAPVASRLSAQDLNSLTAADQLVQFDLAECSQIAAGGASAQTLAVSHAICADAAGYQGQLKAIALARNVTLPSELSYELNVKILALEYYAAPNVNAQYLHDAIDSHEEALAIFHDEGVNGHDPEIMAFDAGAVPVVQRNLDALEAANVATN